MKKVFIDFETYYSTADGYELKKLSVHEYVRDARFKVHGMGVALGDGPAAWIPGPRVHSWFEHSDLTDFAVVAHNAKFDGFIAQNYYGAKVGRWIDTLGMANAVLGKLTPGGSLATLAKHYGLQEKGIMQTNGVRDLTAAQEADLATYCLHDVELCRAIYERMAPAFPEGEYDQLDWTVRAFIEPRLVLNQKILEQAVVDEQQRKALLLTRAGRDKAIFSSNAKFAKLLEEKGYEVPLKKSLATGKPIPALAQGDEAFFDFLHSENNELRELCETRIAVKSTLLETRAGRLSRISSTGPWSFDVVYSGAKQTHRLSGGSGAGGNPQNFTRGSALRKAVEAPAGYKLIVGDFSMIECRLVAQLSNDPALLAALEGDPYCDFASMFYGRTITKKDEAERRFGKEAILGLGYGMGAKTFRVRVKLKTGQSITEDEARRAVDLYRNRYIFVPDLWQRLDAAIEGLYSGDCQDICNLHTAKGIIYLPSGLPIRFNNLRRVWSEKRAEWVYDAWGKSKAAPETAKLYGGKLLENISQALAGELCKEAGRFFGLHRITGTVHDEIHALVADDGIVERQRLSLQQTMETPPAWMPQLKLRAEVGIGQNWLSAK